MGSLTDRGGEPPAERDAGHTAASLVRLAAQIAGAPAPQEIAARAAHEIRAVTRAEDCDVWWLDEGYLRCLASVDGNGIDVSVDGIVLDLDCHPSTARTLAEREILVCPTFDDPRITQAERAGPGSA